ncbi:thiamine-binding protein [Alkalitalea saponilacus]|uniref:Uncharacterized protein, MTH1187 family n=1 Tax=Alkalitalea saponilacus TaxID=889453 RepID=A0A1T5H5M4_9BACT|nr:thiamine-binding protein [Alkalitalea saponilacus]ASB50868.1 hypothetical protein CDL62_17790 [Alkalitalea saponilacus]SKC15993.1 uncharacterized protein, MTH1187 family [Alkalitalea saponilacus]
MNQSVNVAVQVIPVAPNHDLYEIVDQAISVIINSGVKYQVTPFETVMEGDYNQLMEIVKQVQEVCYTAGADKIICFIKIESSRDNAVLIEDKTGKYIS